MAKLFASEAAHRVVFDAMRIFGGYGYSPEYLVERCTETPLMIIGEGTNEIQRLVIARRLLESDAWPEQPRRQELRSRHGPDTDE